MRGFNQIPSLIQIWLAQIAVLLFFSDAVVKLAYHLFGPPEGIVPTRFGWFDLVPWAIGAFSLVWRMRSIFAPRFGKVRWVPVFQAGPAVMWSGTAAIRYAFPSRTRPTCSWMRWPRGWLSSSSGHGARRGRSGASMPR